MKSRGSGGLLNMVAIHILHLLIGIHRRVFKKVEMNYKRKKLQTELDSLLGESINNVFYFTEYEGYDVFQQLSHETVEVPLLGILLETSSERFYNIISYDYAPYYNLGGVHVFRDEFLKTPQGRPNQINEVFWNDFRKKKITNIFIIENFHKKSEEEISIPFGLNLVFEGGEECFIMNLSIEGFIESNQSYDFCRGGELVLLSGRNTYDKYPILKENMFYI